MKIFLTLLMLFGTGIIKAQTSSCLLEKETFYYVRVSIYPKNNYPVLMDGLSRELNLNDMKLQNEDSLITSFYRNAYYTPDLNADNYARSVTYCMGDSAGSQFIHTNPLLPYTWINNIEKHTQKKKYTLLTGEQVVIKVTRIEGRFWKMDKNNSVIRHSSNERDISKISEITNCYLPQNITSICKPKL